MRHGCALAAGDGAGQGGHDVLEQGFAGAAGLLGSVENGDPPDMFRQCGQQVLD